jgi:hypothetical protein
MVELRGLSHFYSIGLLNTFKNQKSKIKNTEPIVSSGSNRVASCIALPIPVSIASELYIFLSLEADQ